MSCSSAHSRDRGELAGAPHERPVERAVVGAVGVDAVAGGDHVVEAEQVGQRLDQVVRRGRGQHDRPAGGAVLVEQRRGQRLHHRDAAGRAAVAAPPAPRRCDLPLASVDGLAGQRHRRQRLADRVEQAVQQCLARDRAADQAGLAHRRGEHLAGGAGQQRAVEVEERSTRRPSRRAGSERLVISVTVRQNGKDPAWGKRGLST